MQGGEVFALVMLAALVLPFLALGLLRCWESLVTQCDGNTFETIA